MRYTSETLIQYCSENKIELVNEYSSENINRESYIEGKCITENWIFDKEGTLLDEYKQI